MIDKDYLELIEIESTLAEELLINSIEKGDDINVND